MLDRSDITLLAADAGLSFNEFMALVAVRKLKRDGLVIAASLDPDRAQLLAAAVLSAVALGMTVEEWTLAAIIEYAAETADAAELPLLPVAPVSTAIH